MHPQTPTKSKQPRSYLVKLGWFFMAFIGISLLTSLGCWQLSRAQEKKVLLKSFAERTAQLLSTKSLTATADLRFFRANLRGAFDNQHTFLLDNKIFHSEVGYEVYTPFMAEGIKEPILVDRGFVPIGVNRHSLPSIKSIMGIVQFEGLLNLPPKYVALGAMQESPRVTWPLRIEYLNITEMAKLIHLPLFPYIISLAPTSDFAYPMEWQVVTMGPERHLGYAVQWFALALTLLILSVVLSRS